MEVLRWRGFGIPDDVAVLGFDDVPLAQELIPALTTVRIPFAELGRTAADLLLHMIKQDTYECVAEIVPLELIKRGTA